METGNPLQMGKVPLDVSQRSDLETRSATSEQAGSALSSERSYQPLELEDGLSASKDSFELEGTAVAVSASSHKWLQMQIALSFIVMFTEGYYATSSIPYNPHMTEELRGSTDNLGFYAGLVYAAVSVGKFITSVPWGWTAEKRGRRPCLLFGLLVGSVGNLLLAISTSYWAVFSVRLFSAALNPSMTIMRTVLREVHQDAGADDTKAFALLSMGFAASLMLGPSISALLYGTEIDLPAPIAAVVRPVVPTGTLPAWFLPSFVPSVMYAMAFTLSFWVLPETKKTSARRSLRSQPQSAVDSSDSESEESSSATRGSFCKLTFVMLLLMEAGRAYVFTGWEQVYSLFASTSGHKPGEHWSTPAVGTTFFCGGLVMMLYMLAVYPSLVKRVGPLNLWLTTITIALITLPLFPRLVLWMVPHRVRHPVLSLPIVVLNYGTQIVVSICVGGGSTTTQLLLNRYMASLPKTGNQLALANSVLTTVQQMMWVVTPLLNGELFEFSRHSTVRELLSWRFLSLVSQALPFDVFLVAGGVACLGAAVFLKWQAPAFVQESS